MKILSENKYTLMVICDCGRKHRLIFNPDMNLSVGESWVGPTNQEPWWWTK